MSTPSKYQKALSKLALRAANLSLSIMETKEAKDYMLSNIYEDRDTLQELVNRDNNHFAHILKFTEKDGRKHIIAFHSSQEADAFVEKNGIKSAHLDSIQFFNEETK